MADLRARVAYVKGLLSGFGTGDGDRSERLSEEIIKIIHEFAEEIEDLKSAHEGLEEYVQALDEDLYAVETVVFGEDEEESAIGAESKDENTETSLHREFALDSEENYYTDSSRKTEDVF